MTKDLIHQAADYIHSETDKQDAGLDYTLCLIMARHLDRLLSGKSPPPTSNISQNHRQRYEGDNWDNGHD